MTPATDANAARLKREVKIAHRLVTDALAAGYSVSVYDGEDWAIRQSTARAAICNALCSTDEDVLHFHPEKPGPVAGWVRLIWGNDCDLISDASDNPAMAALLKGAEALAERLAR